MLGSGRDLELRWRLCVPTVVLAVALIPSVCHADPIVRLPDAIFGTRAAQNGYGGNLPSSITGRSCNPLVPTYCEGASAGASGAAGGTVTISGFSNDPSGATVSYAAAAVSYDFEVLGTPGTLVPVEISAQAHTSFSGTSLGTPTVVAAINWADAINGLHSFNVCSSTPETYCESYDDLIDGGSLDTTFGVEADTVSGITLQVAGSSGAGVGSFSAWADPSLTIDPSFLADHPDYSIVFSPNITPVPEPPMGLLFGTGLLGMLGMLGMRWGRRSLSASGVLTDSRG